MGLSQEDLVDGFLHNGIQCGLAEGNGTCQGMEKQGKWSEWLLQLLKPSGLSRMDNIGCWEQLGNG